jgi:hypothetical protein
VLFINDGHSSWDIKNPVHTRPTTGVFANVSATGQSAFLSAVVYGGLSAGLRGLVAGGSVAVPAATPIGVNLCVISGQGYGTGWNPVSVRLVMRTTEAHTATGRGSDIAFDTVVIGTSTPTALLDVNGAIRCGNYTVGTAPSASANGAGAQIYVSNESGGAVLAFSDGTNWRRVTDRAIIS